MNARTASHSNLARGLGMVLALLFLAALSAASPVGLLAADPSAPAGSAVSPQPTITPAEAACQSAEDLRLVVDFVRHTDVSQDGWAPVLVGAIAGVSEAHRLAGLLDQTYQPLVSDLITSLEDLRATVDTLDQQGTAGAKLAAVGEAITAVGNAWDALSVQLRSPCPTQPAASPAASGQGG